MSTSRRPLGNDPCALTPDTLKRFRGNRVRRAAPGEPLAITSKARDRSCSRSRARTPKRHERRGHRGQQSPVDGPFDRAALAADQGAARLRRRFHLLFLLRQANLQRAGVAVRLGGGRGKFEVHLHGAAGIFPDPVEAGAVWRRVHLVPDCGDANLQVCGARTLQARARGVPALSDRDAGVLRAWLDAGLFRCIADAGAVLARHAAAGWR